MKKQRHIHLGVSGILMDCRGRILLGQRNLDDEAYPGMFCTPGGGVEFGETLDLALQREFVEEVGLGVVIGSTVAIEERFRDADHHTVLVFKQVYFRGAAKRARALDGFRQIVWWDRSTIFRHGSLITPATRSALGQFLHLHVNENSTSK